MLYNNISKHDRRVFTVSPDKSQNHGGEGFCTR